MKTYFESKDGYIIPFNKVLFIVPNGFSLIRVYYGKEFKQDYIHCSIDDLNEYKTWLEATASTDKEPKKTTLTAEQVAKIVKEIECDCHLYCKNNKNNCMFCNFEPTDEFVAIVNEVLND